MAAILIFPSHSGRGLDGIVLKGGRSRGRPPSRCVGGDPNPCTWSQRSLSTTCPDQESMVSRLNLVPVGLRISRIGTEKQPSRRPCQATTHQSRRERRLRAVIHGRRGSQGPLRIACPNPTRSVLCFDEGALALTMSRSFVPLASGGLTGLHQAEVAAGSTAGSVSLEHIAVHRRALPSSECSQGRRTCCCNSGRCRRP